MKKITVVTIVINTTQFQISCQNWNDFLSNICHQMMWLLAAGFNYKLGYKPCDMLEIRVLSLVEKFSPVFLILLLLYKLSNWQNDNYFRQIDNFNHFEWNRWHFVHLLRFQQHVHISFSAWAYRLRVKCEIFYRKWGPKSKVSTFFALRFCLETPQSWPLYSLVSRKHFISQNKLCYSLQKSERNIFLYIRNTQLAGALGYLTIQKTIWDSHFWRS